MATYLEVITATVELIMSRTVDVIVVVIIIIKRYELAGIFSLKRTNKDVLVINNLVVTYELIWGDDSKLQHLFDY